MRLTKTAWLILGIGIFIIATVSLYMVYQGQVQERQEAEDGRTKAEAARAVLIAANNNLENQLAQLESDLEQWQNELTQSEAELSQLEADRAQAISQAMAMLDETEAKFISSTESIEYDEVLFGFTYASNLMITRLIASETDNSVEEGITYYTTTFSATVRGEVADILDFITTVVTDANFKTTIVEPVNITVTEPLTDEQKEIIEEGIRTGLIAEALAELTTEDILGFTLEAVEEVTGQRIDVRTVEEMAETIRAKIAGSVEEYVLESGDLAELIAERISGSIVQKIVYPLAQEIYDLILEVGEDESREEALIELLGEDIAELFGAEIEGALPGDISGLLYKYIAQLVEEKMVASAAEVVEESVEEITAKTIEDMEMSSATITLTVYTYQGE